METNQEAPNPRHEARSTEETHAITDEGGSGSSEIQNSNDIEIADQDGSDPSQYEDVVEQLGGLNIEGSASPSETTVQAPHLSNATVPPVDIVLGNRGLNTPHPPGNHVERILSNGRTRTPSPNGTSSSLDVALTTTEGPMTPRNDVGPFIFDGSAGRSGDARMAAIASNNLNPTADTPPPRLTPQTVP